MDATFRPGLSPVGPGPDLSLEGLVDPRISLE